MAVNTRFATGVHALALLASEPDVLQTSDDVAGKLKTNPVVIRRVFSLLHQAGLVESQKGPHGGSKLKGVFEDAEAALRDELKKTSVGDLVKKSGKKGKKR